MKFKDMTALEFVERLAKATNVTPLLLAAMTLKLHPDHEPDDNYFERLAEALALCYEPVLNEPAQGIYYPAPHR